MKIQVSASIMAGKFSQVAVDKAQVCDRIHVDIMDGKYVDNKTIGSDEVSSIRSRIPIDAHLMVEDPVSWIKNLAGTGVSRISFHAETVETAEDGENILSLIRSHGIEAGIAIDAYTLVEKAEDLLGKADFVLVMSVKAGKGGQRFMPSSLNKITTIRESFPDLDIEIDGGIDPETAPGAIKAGANILVSGSYLFKGDFNKNISVLRKKIIEG